MIESDERLKHEGTRLNSIKIDKSLLSKLNDILLDLGFSVQSKKSVYEFNRYYKGSSNSLVIVYNSGSVVLRNFDPYYLVERLYVNNGIFIGCDEAGKGEIYGSIFCACVCLKATELNFLISSGVKDSKELDDDKINSLAELIKTKALFIKVVKISPELIKSSNKLNLNGLLTNAYTKCLTACYDFLIRSNFYLETVTAIIDQYDLKECIKLSEKFPKLLYVEKAERFPIVSCASIIARYYYLNEANKKQKWEK
ncbi:MAG: hypothetical protein N3E37_01805 [Candidatus Micrarchaeota archaeon]|nr:hypothetical protein [Candidatus Micrarchaeota archaeon]